MKKIVILLLLAALVAAGCYFVLSPKEGKTNEELAWYENDSLLQADLAAAIRDAQQLDTSKISHSLVPIRKDYPGEEWTTIDGHDMVLCVTLVDSSRLQRFFSRDDLHRIDRETGTWVTLPVNWKQKKQAFAGLDSIAAHMRMIQMYGLSPDCDYDIMVEFYADPKTTFRPAHDPDITTTSAGLDFPSYADEKYTIGETNFREWYRYSVSSAYEDDSPLPWTQLGYTYDWHHGAPREGLSEYVVSHNSLIKVKKHQTAWQFVKNL